MSLMKRLIEGEPLPSAAKAPGTQSEWQTKAEAVCVFWLDKLGSYTETDQGVPEGGATGNAIGGTFDEINERRARSKMERFSHLGKKAERGELLPWEIEEVQKAWRRLPAGWRDA